MTSFHDHLIHVQARYILDQESKEDAIALAKELLRLCGEARVEEQKAFEAGWWLNAAVPSSEDEGRYFHGACEADWLEYLRTEEQHNEAV
ncbi:MULTISPECIES: hypothetical protein [unclassified Beijerinckia]|uniref:hypothetical protein n=1 Tax=unclassified Beijerinckia TaxID=2638183 RepID=UPI00089630E1|nr:MULTISPECIES: hypothetical protein [unclassified Beijerinckia]MDH7796379.1 hypothetical protein [Beijerinckia sp. GAS462]SEC42625.1 hypothetical protein SAMN05443249_2662 [Beijerinckia sp. 28-YEA-48]